MNQLIYIYVENFQDFEPTFLNFSNDLYCQVIEKTLFVHQRDNYFTEVLGESVVDINVIAGENGVGKTQLLKMLAELACGAITHDYFANYRYLMVHRTAERELVVSSNFDIQFYLEPLPGYSISEAGDILSPVVYFSPFLDFNPLEVRTHVKRKPIVDLSQSYYVMQDTEQSQKKMDIIPTILTLKTNNILRQVEFVVRKPLEIAMPFILPSQLSVRFNRLKIDKDDVSIDDRGIFDKLNRYCSAFFRDAKDNGISQEQMAKLMFYRNLLTFFLVYQQQQIPINPAPQVW